MSTSDAVRSDSFTPLASTISPLLVSTCSCLQPLSIPIFSHSNPEQPDACPVSVGLLVRATFASFPGFSLTRPQHSKRSRTNTTRSRGTATSIRELHGGIGPPTGSGCRGRFAALPLVVVIHPSPDESSCSFSDVTEKTSTARRRGARDSIHSSTTHDNDDDDDDDTRWGEWEKGRGEWCTHHPARRYVLRPLFQHHPLIGESLQTTTLGLSPGLS